LSYLHKRNYGSAIAKGSALAEFSNRYGKMRAIAKSFPISGFRGDNQYTNEELLALAENPESRDYKKVLKRFVSEQIGKEIASFQTASRTVNPREVLVITTDHQAIQIRMQKWNNYDQIWTVTGYNDLYPTEHGEEIQRYRSIKIADAPQQVQDWAGKLLTAPEWKKEFLRLGNQTYILLKTSSSRTDSVDMEEIGFGAGEIQVSYQTYAYSQSADPSLINDYVLLEADYPADHVSFTETYAYRE
jgi:hypothetical protein